MPLWMLTPIPGGRVAIRIRRVDDRARRVAMDTDEVREEWRCGRCSEWFPRETVRLVRSGRAVGGVPEIAAYCESCAHGPTRVRGTP
jgi:hypothetical protein